MENMNFETIEIDGSIITYQITDVIEQSKNQRELWDNNPEWREKLQRMGIHRPPVRLDPKADAWPEKISYTFQEFAGPVFETGGYGDMTMVDPYTLKRLWVGHAFEPGTNIYKAMQHVLAVAEKLNFLGNPDNDEE